MERPRAICKLEDFAEVLTLQAHIVAPQYVTVIMHGQLRRLRDC